MLVCLGAALTMVLSQYEYVMLTTEWADVSTELGIRTDVARFGAQVVNGIGFSGRRYDHDNPGGSRSKA